MSTYLVPTKQTVMLRHESSGTITNSNYPLPSPKNQDKTVELRYIFIILKYYSLNFLVNIFFQSRPGILNPIDN